MVLLLGVGGVSAKTSTTTLWEGSYTGNIEIPVANLVQGATITVSATVTTTMNADDKKLRIFYCKNDNDWHQTSFTDISDWVELTVGEVSHSFTVTEAAMNILNDNTENTGSRGVMYIGANNKDYVSISKITQTTEIIPTSETDLLDENWVVAGDGWESKNFAAQASAKIGDVILFDITVASGWKYTEVQVKDSEGNAFENSSSYTGNFADETSETFEYEINNAKDLEKIQSAGFRINASNHATIKSIKLLSYADSYDAVSITVGSDGVATYSNSGKNVQISACNALKAYYASAVTTGTVTLTELTGCIPANTGVMVFGEAGTYTVPVGSEGWPSISTNYLKATGDYSAEVAASTSGKFHYIFAKKKESSDEPGFYKLTAAYTLGAHKAYLETTTDITPNNARVALVFSDEAETTGISASLGEKVEKASEHIYNLRGMRVTQPQKGLYIKNGKKMIIR